VYIVKNILNKVPLTLSENASQPLHDWLFEFRNETTGDTKTASLVDISVWPSRYNLFEITDSTTEDFYNGFINFTPTGSWTYKAYEMPVMSPPSLDKTLAYKLVKEGDFKVFDPDEIIDNSFNEDEVKNNGVFDE